MMSVEGDVVHVCDLSDGEWSKVFQVSDAYAIRSSKIALSIVLDG